MLGYRLLKKRRSGRHGDKLPAKAFPRGGIVQTVNPLFQRFDNALKVFHVAGIDGLFVIRRI